MASSQLRTLRRMFGVITAGALGALAACDDTSVDPPPTSKKITFQLSAEVGGGEAGRAIAVRAFYIRNGTQEVELAVEPSTFAVSANTATGTVSVDVLPCISDANREGAADGAGRCRVHLEAELRASNGMSVSEDETVVMVTPTAASLTVEPFTLPSGALVPSSASVELIPDQSGQLPAAVTVDIAPSGALQPGTLSAAIVYVDGTGWLSAVIPAGETEVTIVPTTTALAPGRYEAIVRITSAWMFTPTEIHVAYVVPHPPQTVTITGAGNGTGLVLVTPNNASCTTSAGVLSGFCAVPAAHGSPVTLTPAAAVGSGFTGWSGACQGTAPCTLTMDQDRAVTATFMILKRDLTVDAAGTGSGSITSTPAGISCSAAAGAESGTCAAQFDHPTQVTLTATPNSATSTFTGWSGACQGTGACVVTMTEARAVTATFALIRRRLVVTMAGEGTGTVTSSPAGIDCTMTNGQRTGSCSADFDHGITVVLTATLGGTNMTFTGWSGDCTGTGTCTVTMDRTRFVTATIVPPLFPLTIMVTGNTGGYVTFLPERPGCTLFGPGHSCTRDFPVGSRVEIHASSSSSFGAMSLSGCNSISNGGLSASCWLTMDGPRIVTANFIRPSTRVTVLGAGTGAGRVGGLFIDCRILAGQTSGQCSSDLYGMQSTSVTATPEPGSTFAGWTGCSDIFSDGLTCYIRSLASAVLTATFTASPPPPEPSPSPTP